MTIMDDYKSICNQIAEAESNNTASTEMDMLLCQKSSLEDLLMNRYRVVLSTLCGYLGLVNRYTDLYEKGSTPDNNVLCELTMRLAGLKEELLALKESLHLPGELSFMEDNCFDGFEIRQGRFIGDQENVKRILRKWLEGFPATANTYQYEVAVFVYFLAFPECFDSAEEPVKVSPLKLLGRRFQIWRQRLLTKSAS